MDNNETSASMKSDMNSSLSSSSSGSSRAILVIDMQNDFVRTDGILYVAGAAATVPAIKRFLENGRRSGWHIIYVCRTHRPSGVDAESFRRHLFEEGRPFCVEGTSGADIIDELRPEPGDLLVRKQRFSAFYSTDLDLILRSLGVGTLYITGTQYPNCVRSTAVDAMSRDYRTIVVTDCCSAADPETEAANIRDLSNMGIPCHPSSTLGEASS